MNTGQYTIRGIPVAILEKVDSESKRTKRSKNEILLGAINDAFAQDVKHETKWYEKYLGTLTAEDARNIAEASKESRTLHPKDYL